MVWETERCPSCQEVQSVPLAAGGRLCLACRYEWEPAVTTGPLETASVTTIGVDVPIDLVPTGADAQADIEAQVAAARAAYVGRRAVVHELEQEGEIESVTDGGYAIVAFGSGFYVACTPDEFSLVDEPAAVVEMSDADVVELGSIDLTVAALVVRAAVGSFVEDDAGRRIGLAPNGWLPQDSEAWPVVEHGASYAVAILADLYGITTDQLSAIADSLETAAQAAKEGTES